MHLALTFLGSGGSLLQVLELFKAHDLNHERHCFEQRLQRRQLSFGFPCLLGQLVQLVILDDTLPKLCHCFGDRLRFLLHSFKLGHNVFDGISPLDNLLW